MKAIKYILSVIMVSLSIMAKAQNPAQDKNSDTQPVAIKIQASVSKDEVVLRWAPTTPVAWKLLNQYGYKVERFTMVRDDQVLVDKPQIVLKDVFKPAASASWKASMEDDYVAVAAQAIFGTSFEVTGNGGNNIADIVQQSRELDMRFSFALLAADVSPKAADLSALRIVDSHINKKEKYLYRIHSLVPESIAKIEMGFIFVSPEEIAYLPVPPSPVVRRMERAVMLSWDTEEFKQKYTGYFVEKSVDGGKTYSKLNSTPIVNLEAPNEGERGLSIKGDSLLENTTVDNIRYALRGITAFGELSPLSEPSAITDEEPLKENPILSKPTISNNEEVELNWTFSTEKETAIVGFRVERRSKLTEEFELVNKQTIKAGDRQYTDKSPHATNYYRIAAFTKGGQRTYSFDHLVQLEDSIPPSRPTELVGYIDSTGVVVLKWKANSEVDLAGYRVFRSNFKTVEFGQITKDPTPINLFADSVNIHTLTKSIWYKITAIDNRYNMSEFSEMIEVLLPDIIPPVQPVITNIKATDKGVELHFIPSSSFDVVRHEVLRRRVEETQWSVAGIVTKMDTCCIYLDSLSDSRGYLYSVIAVDDNGLKSELIKPVFRGMLKRKEFPPIEKITTTVDRARKQISLNWVYKDSVDKFQIFRAQGAEQMVLYSSVNGSIRAYLDQRVQPNTVYIYRIKAINNDGSESVFSKAISVKY